MIMKIIDSDRAVDGPYWMDAHTHTHTHHQVNQAADCDLGFGGRGLVFFFSPSNEKQKAAAPCRTAWTYRWEEM